MNGWNPLSLAAVLVLAAGLAGAQTAGTGHGEERFHTRLVGAHDLQGRSAYQPLPVRQGECRILYVGHHAGEAVNPLTGAIEPNGTSAVDVTDPAAPVYLAPIPATGGASGAQMVQVCDGNRLLGADPGRFYLLRSNGNRSHEVWGVTNPAAPRSCGRRPRWAARRARSSTRTRTGGSAPPTSPTWPGPSTAVEIADYAGKRGHATRDFLFVVSESVANACQGPRHVTPMLDITDEAHPLPIGVSSFNAGARVIDIRHPFNVQAVASCIPATTARTAERRATIDGVDTRRVAVQMNNVEVDDRVLTYLPGGRADTAVHIVELTGLAKAIIED